jgi:hypothetical protein
VKVADMDTVDKYLRFLPANRLEDIKHNMFRAIVKSKVFQKYKFNDEYFMLAIDGSGLQSFDYEPYPGCPYKEYKSGRKVWTTYVLEAKIVTENGFSISLATQWLKHNYKIFKDHGYKGHQLYVVEIEFEKQHQKTGEKENTRFVHISNKSIDKKNAHQVSQAGRLRWKIENEGFNNQKNNDYNLQHKFSRTNFNATKNYYQLMQIADIINQFTYKQKAIQHYLKDHGFTIRSIIADILSYLKSMVFSDKLLIEQILT